MLPSWDEILLKIVPLDVYCDLRDDLIDIFIEAYRQYPEAQEAFDEESVPNLRETVITQTFAAKSYDPHQAVHDRLGFFGGLYSVIKAILLAGFAISVLTSMTSYTALTRQSLQLLESLSGFILRIALGASSGVSLFLVGLLLYIRLLTANTFVVQTLNGELVIGPKKTTKTRDKPQLVGHLIWNSSLNGGKALHLLAIFSVLKVLSAVPRWDPYEAIRSTVEDNIDVFVGVDGYLDAGQRVFRRIRDDDDDE